MAPVVILGLFEFVRVALVLSLLPLFGQYVAGYSLSTIGTAVAAHYLLDNCFRVPAGWVVDRWGARWLAAGGTVLAAVGISVMYLHPSPQWFVAGAALFGLGLAPVWPAVLAGVVATIPSHRVGEALSTVFAAWLVGSGLGPVVINLLLEWGYGPSFAFLLGMLVLALLLVLNAELPAHMGLELPPAQFFAELVRDLGAVRVLYPGMFAQTMSLGLLIPVIALFARTTFGLSPAQFSSFLVGAGVCTVLLLVPAGRLADRQGPRVPLVAGFGTAALLLVLLPLQRSLQVAFVMAALIGVCYALILPAWNGVMARVLTPEKRGTMWAFFMTVEGVGNAAGAFLSGRVWDAWGPHAPFWVSGAVLAAMAVLYAGGVVERLMASLDRRPGHGGNRR
ncbi:MAG: MFS transporter [Syntrophomonadaceae bacterium]|jgi:MFS family permease|nr:MFS transporter [Syntrophomonadaceae bacterium]